MVTVDYAICYILHFVLHNDNNNNKNNKFTYISIEELVWVWVCKLQNA